MSKYKDKVKEFDQFFIDNYSKLLMNANSITSHYDYSSDIVNDVYLKVRQRIELSGFTGTNYFGFCWMSIQNDWFVLCNRKKIRHFIDIDDHDNHFNDIERAEQYLLTEEEWNQKQEEYYQKIEFIVRILFNYIETNYNEKESYLFKTYFLLGETYKQLSVRTNYSQAYISNTIKPMKRDLRNNFTEFLKSKS